MEYLTDNDIRRIFRSVEEEYLLIDLPLDIISYIIKFLDRKSTLRLLTISKELYKNKHEFELPSVPITYLTATDSFFNSAKLSSIDEIKQKKINIKYVEEKDKKYIFVEWIRYFDKNTNKTLLSLNEPNVKVENKDFIFEVNNIDKVRIFEYYIRDKNRTFSTDYIFVEGNRFGILSRFTTTSLEKDIIYIDGNCVVDEEQNITFFEEESRKKLGNIGNLRAYQINNDKYYIYYLNTEIVFYYGSYKNKNYLSLRKHIFDSSPILEKIVRNKTFNENLYNKEQLKSINFSIANLIANLKYCYQVEQIE